MKSDYYKVLGLTRTATQAEIVKAHRRLAQKYHPDHNGGDIKAEAKFKVIQEAYDVLSDPAKKRQYDHSGEIKDDRPIPVRHKSRTYLVGQPIGGSDIADLYRCTYEDGKPKIGIFKIVRQPRDNDLAANEVEVLKALHKDAPLQTVFFPDVVDAFPVTDGRGRRHVTVFPKTEGFFSLEEIYQAYPDGIDARDMAWMFNRIMEALYFTHRAGYLHGAVLPTNLLFQTDDHGLILSEWSFAVAAKKGGYIKAMSNKYKSWYPPEVKSKLTPTPATDIYMAANCVVKLLGGDPISGVMPNVVPRRIHWFLKACLVPAPSRRPNDVGALREEFGGLLRELYGKRIFRPFTMPHTVGV